MTIWAIAGQKISNTCSNRQPLLESLSELKPFFKKTTGQPFNYAIALNVTDLKQPVTQTCGESGSGALTWKPTSSTVTREVKAAFKDIAEKARTDNARASDTFVYASQTITTMSARPVDININFDKPVREVSAGAKSRATTTRPLPRAARPSLRRKHKDIPAKMEETLGRPSVPTGQGDHGGQCEQEDVSMITSQHVTHEAGPQSEPSLGSRDNPGMQGGPQSHPTRAPTATSQQSASSLSQSWTSHQPKAQEMNLDNPTSTSADL